MSNPIVDSNNVLGISTKWKVCFQMMRMFGVLPMVPLVIVPLEPMALPYLPFAPILKQWYHWKLNWCK